LRDDRILIEDMLLRARRVAAIAQEMSYEQFLADERAYEATLRNIEIIGEAAKGVSEKVRVLAPDVPWRLIVRTRDVLAHVYFGIKDEIIWDIVEAKSGELIRSLETLLTLLPESET
jgi:uncharacterized protein with HEPN domain